MVCIYCQHETNVTNSRKRPRNPSVWRRRQCFTCVAQFTTIELPDYNTAIAVKLASSNLKPFSRDKLFLSLHKSLGHRENSLESATMLTESVIGSLLRHKDASGGVVAVTKIANAAYLTLKRYDPLSAHTYKAYHQASLR